MFLKREILSKNEIIDVFLKARETYIKKINDSNNLRKKRKDNEDREKETPLVNVQPEKEK